MYSSSSNIAIGKGPSPVKTSMSPGQAAIWLKVFGCAKENKELNKRKMLNKKYVYVFLNERCGWMD